MGSHTAEPSGRLLLGLCVVTVIPVFVCRPNESNVSPCMRKKEHEAPCGGLGQVPMLNPHDHRAVMVDPLHAEDIRP